MKGLYEKRGWFYFQPTTPKGGGPRPSAVALKTQDLVTAIQRMNENRMDVAMERAVVSGTLKEVLPRYYEAKWEDVLATRRPRKVILDQFMREMGNPRAEEITAELVTTWRKKLAARKNRSGALLSGTTIKSYTIALRAFVNWLLEEKILRVDPMKQLTKQTKVAATRMERVVSRSWMISTRSGESESRNRRDASKSASVAESPINLGFLPMVRVSLRSRLRR